MFWRRYFGHLVVQNIVAIYLELCRKSRETLIRPPGTLKQSATEQKVIARASGHRI